MSAEEQLDRLTGIVESLSRSVLVHDEQIANLIRLADERLLAAGHPEK
jgi:hypothetical protein